MYVICVLACVCEKSIYITAKVHVWCVFSGDVNLYVWDVGTYVSIQSLEQISKSLLSCTAAILSELTRGYAALRTRRI